MLIRSVFNNHGPIPVRYTGDGEDISPSIDFLGVPENVKSFVLMVDDPDAPIGDWVHWIVFNISSNVRRIEEDSIPDGALLGINDSMRLKYHGPAPPYGIHRYFFKAFALDCMLNLPEGAKKQDILKAIEGHIIDKAELIGTYKRR